MKFVATGTRHYSVKHEVEIEAETDKDAFKLAQRYFKQLSPESHAIETRGTDIVDDLDMWTEEKYRELTERR